MSEGRDSRGSETGRTSDELDVESEADEHRDTVGAVARGGSLNLIGAVVYGISGFVLLVILNQGLTSEEAGRVILAIAIFNIATKVAEAGCATGLIRTVSRLRAIERTDELRGTVVVAVIPVALWGAAVSALLYLSAPVFAELFSDPTDASGVADVVRAMAWLVPFAALQSVVVQGTRGFDTMVPQLLVEKIARGVAMPVAVAAAILLDAGPKVVGVAWAATNVVALMASGSWFLRLLTRATSGVAEHRSVDRELALSFWRYTAPRAAGQTFEVTINWIDTILVGALVSETAAGIYASGTRYLLIGLFTAEAIMQVVGPRMSGLLSQGRTRLAQSVLHRATSWQVMLVWPTYIVVGAFAPLLLKLFGEEVVEARWALLALSAAMLVAALLGPAASVILMSGRSRTSLLNTFVTLAVNLAGNAVCIPRWGITGAGAVWGVTIVVAAGLPAWQAHRQLGVSTWGRAAFVTAACAAVGVGIPVALARLLLGASMAGLLIGGSVGLVGYLVLLHRNEDEVAAVELVRTLLRRGPSSDLKHASGSGANPSRLPTS